MPTTDSHVVVIPHMTAALRDLLHVVALFSDGTDDNRRGGCVSPAAVEFLKATRTVTVRLQ